MHKKYTLKDKIISILLVTLLWLNPWMDTGMMVFADASSSTPSELGYELNDGPMLLFDNDASQSTPSEITFENYAGDVVYEEGETTLIDWKTITRPAVLTDSFKLQPYDENGNPIGDPIDTQHDPEKPFYLTEEFNDDATVHYEVRKVPQQLFRVINEYTDEEEYTYYETAEEVPMDATPINVAYYEIMLEQAEESDSDQPQSLYYCDPVSTTGSSLTLVKKLKFEPLYVTKMLLPERADDTEFTLNVNFSNPLTNAKFDKAMNLMIKQNRDTCIMVPVGIAYSITEQSETGYQFIRYDAYKTDWAYSTEQEADLSLPALELWNQFKPTIEQNGISGVVQEGKAIRLVVVNSFSNNICEFAVHWYDNESKDRPKNVTYTLQYTTASALGWDTDSDEWITVDESTLSDLGLDKMPQYQNGEGDVYYFDGLPSVNSQKMLVKYRVVQSDLDDYIVDKSQDTDGIQVFENTMATRFESTIVWYDSSNSMTTRPDVSDYLPSLTFARYDHDGNITKLNINNLAILPSDNNTWTITSDELPLYNKQNEDYSYVLLQGTFGEKMSNVTQTKLSVAESSTAGDGAEYRTSYHNGSGNHGNETAFGYSGGTIYQTLYAETEVSVKVEWKDPEGATRPNTTLVLWRYSLKGTTDAGIDDNFENNAARVIYHNPTNDKDILLAFDISSENHENLELNPTKVTGVPDGYMLPAFDEQGNRYVYFVREMLTGGNSYRITYSGNQKNGTLNGGTITNKRSEKVQVDITKTWVAPSAMNDFNGATVQMGLYDVNGNKLQPVSPEKDNMEPLSDTEAKEVTTTETFNLQNASRTISYYVDAFDEQGAPIDFSTAYVLENSVTGSTNLTHTGHQSHFKIGSHNYKGEVTDYDGTSKAAYYDMQLTNHVYTVKNTIDEPKVYTIIKKWKTDAFKTVEYNTETGAVTLQQDTDQEKQFSLTGIYFDLYGKSENPKNTGNAVTVTNLFVPANETLTWTLPITTDGFTKETSMKIEGIEKNASDMYVLPTYDKDGYRITYRAEEKNASFTDDPLTQPAWSVDYSRNDSSTTASNGPSGPYRKLTFTKEWGDNGDSSGRMPVYIQLYYDGKEYNGEENNVISPIVLNENNLWYTERSVSGDLNMNLFTAREVYLKDDSGQHNANYNSITETTGSSITWKLTGGQVATENRQYKIDITYTYDQNNTGRFVITNTRTGKTALHVIKNWFDGNNYGYGDTNPDNDKYKAKRPEGIQLQILQNGTTFHPSPEYLSAHEGVLTDDPVKGAVLSIRGREPGLTAAMSKLWNSVVSLFSGDEATAVNTMTDEKWEYVLDGLDRFDAYGNPYTYTVEEIGYLDIDENGTELVIPMNDDPLYKNYTMVAEEATVEPTDIDDSIVTNAFTNKKEGTLDDFHVRLAWRDLSTKGEGRPDVFMTLYQYTPGQSDPEPQPFFDYEDQVWEATTSSSLGYDWTITIKNLPQYDESGKPYAYFMRETMNNDGVSGFGTYETTYPTEKERLSMGGEIGKEYASNGDLIVNSLKDSMRINGTKIWRNIEAGYAAKDLPNPTLYLYQYTDSSYQKWRTENPEKDKSEFLNEIGFIDQTTLDETKTSYQFPTAHCKSSALVKSAENENMLDKYDEYGERYIYDVVEKLEGDLQELLYTKNINGYLLANYFKEDINRRSITVEKNWDRSPLTGNEYQYPNVTFRLFRYELPNTITTTEQAMGWVYSQNRLQTEPYRTETITAADSKNQSKMEVKFHDLLIYSPNGTRYAYFIDEVAVNGYVTSYYDANGNATGKNGIAIADIPENITEKTDTSVSVKNTYNPTNTESNTAGIIQLKGLKIWDDYQNSENIYGKRPSSLDITLERRAGSGSNAVEYVNAQLSTTPGAIGYVKWDKTATNAWTYEIQNLPKYAANGEPYTYRVKEEVPKGYTANPGTALGYASKADSNHVVSMSNLKNKFAESYTVRKNWIDGNNNYNLRPSSVTIYLERQEAGSNEWNTISYDAGTMAELPTVNDKEGNPIVGIALTKQNVVANTYGNTWQYTFTNLPASSPDDTKYTYRAREVKIGNTYINDTADKGDPYYQRAGAYRKTSETHDGKQTTIRNELLTTKMVVSKTWRGDSENRYKTRPAELQFVVYQAQKTTDGILHWTVITDADGNEAKKFTLSAANNWTMELQNLPKFSMPEGNDDEPVELLYAVQEVYDAKILGAYENETPGLPKTLEDYESSPESARTLVNELILHSTKTITVNKTWYVTGEHPAAKFELQYQLTGSAEWNTLLTEEMAADAMSLSWDKLPAKMYDKNTEKWKAANYRAVELTPDGYASTSSEQSANDNSSRTYSFTNVQLQNFTVTKTWMNNESYTAKTNSGWTSTVQLQQKVQGEGNWTNVTQDGTVNGQKEVTPNSGEQTLTTTAPNGSKSFTWNNLPMYTTGGTPITYRAVETAINGNSVLEGEVVTNTPTDGNYIGSYGDIAVDGTTVNSFASAFGATEGTITNRLVYGFVNLQKAGAYLTTENTVAGITENDMLLAGTVFDIYAGTTATGTPYVSGVRTDADGHLSQTNGKYGDQQKYLITGTYTLVEKTPNSEYSNWSNGVTFIVGKDYNVNNSTGEHGTAWIYTRTDGTAKPLEPAVKYLDNSGEVPGIDETTKALNLESRGTVRFTKVGSDNTAIRNHSSAENATTAYFGIFAGDVLVAGMIPQTTGSAVMILTDKDQNGSPLQMKNSHDVPYTRTDGTGTTYLLSGPYTVKELVAPAGYKLDTTPRTLVIGKITETTAGATYAGNVGTINDATATADYKWQNVENVVKLYKLDQYGRHVSLNNGGYLVLSRADGNNLLTGENSIYLYQNTATAATKTDGTKVEGITYTVDSNGKGFWTLTGILDGNGSTAYKISEPGTSVNANYLQAYDVTVTVNKDGTIAVAADDTNTVAMDTPLASNGTDYKNYYKADASGNVIVLRDPIRYGHVVLQKISSATDANPIANISFKLFKYDTNPNAAQPVLEYAAYLTTATDGKISTSDEKYNTMTNSITGQPLNTGLDAGNYYLEEVERGASDTYRLGEKVFFRVAPNNENGTYDSNKKYATVTFTASGYVSQDTVSGVATIKNDPVTVKKKTLNLSKVMEDSTALAGASFELTYTSINSTTGAMAKTTYECVTDADGELVLKDAEGNLTNKPNISNKGSYVLQEVKAADSYMTPTENGTATVRTLLTFDVNSSNKIVIINSYAPLVTASVTTVNNEDTALEVTVKNEKTRVSVRKAIETLNGDLLAGAQLEIYEGIYSSADSSMTVLEQWTTDNEAHEVTQGLLKEDTIYTLHEVEAPVGYLEAEDIYFKLHGTYTYTENNKTVAISQLYVWTDAANTPTVNGTGWSMTAGIHNHALTMVDLKIEIPVSLLKVRSDNQNSIAGVTFEVKNKDTNEIFMAITDNAGKLFRQTDNGGVGDVIMLRQNENGYTFTEVTAPSDIYNGEGTVSYNINPTDDNLRKYMTGQKDGQQLQLNIANGEMEAADKFTQAVENNPFSTTLKLLKYDADAKANHAPVSGAEFTLFRGDSTNQNNKVGTYVTTNGILQFNITEKGTYTLKETKAADGYVLPADSYQATFTVTDAHYGKTLTLNEDRNALVNDSNLAQVGNNRLTGSITIQKQDGDDSSGINGATFQLYRKQEGNVLQNLWNFLTGKTYKLYTNEAGENTFDANMETMSADGGSLTIEGLVWGDYLLKETTPADGYVLNPDAEYAFTIDAENLNVDVTDPFRNYQTKLEVWKTDQSGTTLSGIAFELNGNFATATSPISWTSGDSNEKIYGQLMPGETYTLTEVYGKDGYESLTEPVTFCVNEDGTMTVQNNSGFANMEDAMAAANFTQENGVNVLQILNPETISTMDYTVTKEWKNDDAVADSIRPKEISVQLYWITKDDQAKHVVGNPVSIKSDADGNWSHTWDNLPTVMYVKDSNGFRYDTLDLIYQVEEMNPDSLYTVETQYTTKSALHYDGAVNTGATVVNTAKDGIIYTGIENKTEASIGGGSSPIGAIGGMVTTATDTMKPDKTGFKANCVTISWTPDAGWKFDNSFTIQFTEFDGETGSIIVEGYLDETGQPKPITDPCYDTLKERYPNAQIQLENGVMVLTLADDANGLPYLNTVDVVFVPTYAVENTTPQDIGGKVQMENGTASSISDGVPSQDGHDRYTAIRAFGEAENGYCVNMKQLYIGAVDSLHDDIDLEQAYSILSEDSLPKSFAAGDAFPFQITLPYNVNGQTVGFTISGTVHVLAVTGSDAIEVAIALDEASIPLDFGITFEKRGTGGGGGEWTPEEEKNPDEDKDQDDVTGETESEENPGQEATPDVQNPSNQPEDQPGGDTSTDAKPKPENDAETADNPDQKDENGKLPRTGDQAKTAWYMMLFALGTAGLAGVRVRKRK